MKKWAMMLAGGIMLAGCSEKTEKPASQNTQSDEWVVYGDELFSAEEQKRLGAHMDLLGGDAVRISGPAAVTASYELWQNGKIVEPGGTLSPTEKAENISFSIRPSAKANDKDTLTISYNDGNAVFATEISALPVESLAHGAIDLTGIDGMAIAPGEKKAVWGYAAVKVEDVSPGSEKELKQSPWGLIVYIEAAQ
ncbi:hypothetical protein NLX67_00880 [Domibacillus sp. A3M-37]|uniref:hypothetical protein n=1 Tax=Domibacillus sp. A3M-37 TaxID=2962037 RepID=UPI0020B855EE|nr:hypothetical protein [Domibacillus sp. A3M-37]MCP3760948.1 hypothetical protein [Domibacillus sp. A3M-37]